MIEGMFQYGKKKWEGKQKQKQGILNMIVREVISVVIATAIGVYWLMKDVMAEEQCLYSKDVDNASMAVWRSCENPPEWWDASMNEKPTDEMI